MHGQDGPGDLSGTETGEDGSKLTLMLCDVQLLAHICRRLRGL